MAARTKFELQQALNARNIELEAARLRIAELEGDLTAARSKYDRAVDAVNEAQMSHGEALMEIARLKARVNNPRPGIKSIVRPAYQPTPEQMARREAMAAARERAVSSGTCVKVTL